LIHVLLALQDITLYSKPTGKTITEKKAEFNSNTTTMVPRLSLILAAVLFSVGSAASSPADTKQYTLEINHSSRTFLVHCPKNLAAANPSLVIALHGGGTNGKAMEDFCGLSEASERYGFVVLYPNGSGRLKRLLTWNAGSCCAYAKDYSIDDVAFIRQLIDYMIRQYYVDPSRVYVTGISNGAMMAYRLAAEIPDKIAAIAPVAGTLTVAPAAVHAAMPVLHFHGTADQYVPFAGGRGPRSIAGDSYMAVEEAIKVWVRINQALPNPSVEELPALHGDGTSVVRYTYGTARDKQNIVLYKIIGGGHTWPGQPHRERLLGRTTTEISANDIMWEFFRTHVKRSLDKRQFEEQLQRPNVSMDGGG
jgi:polyhydroxybutyrate depolymerase